MAEKTVLLSICIPTYNRAFVLKDTLNRITSDSAFDEEVELIISDNCSTDNTKEVVSLFQKQHSNIRYYCNERNVKDENFIIALSYGHGEYLKLINDYIYFPMGALEYIKDCIRENVSVRIPLFFVEKVKRALRGKVVLCYSLDDYILSVSYFVTWISSFGCWREDFNTLQEKDRYAPLLLQQVDWSYRIVSSKKGCIIYTQNIIKSSAVDLGPRGGYNYLEIHVNNYYRIMLSFLKAGLLSKKVYNIDRKYSLRHYRSRIIKALVFRKRGFDFDMQGSYTILWRYYSDLPVFYSFMFSCFFLRFSLLFYKSIFFPFKYLIHKLWIKQK